MECGYSIANFKTNSQKPNGSNVNLTICPGHNHTQQIFIYWSEKCIISAPYTSIFFLTSVLLGLRVLPLDFFRGLTRFYNSTSLTFLRTEAEITKSKKQASVFLTHMISTRSQEDTGSSVVIKLLPCSDSNVWVCVCMSVCMNVYI